MWLENLKELKKSSKLSSKQIADATGIPESTVKRIFAGDTDNPYVDTLRRIVTVLGGSLDDIFAESKMRVANTDLIALQAAYDKLQAEANELRAENVTLKDKLVIRDSEIERLQVALALKDEMLADKQHIVELQEQLLNIHKNGTNPPTVWKF